MFRRKGPMRYRAGMHIPHGRSLLLLSAGPTDWAHLSRSYPELSHFKKASYHKASRLIIEAPTVHDASTLETIARHSDKTHLNYVTRKPDESIHFIVQHVPGAKEDIVHIYRRAAG